MELNLRREQVELLSKEGEPLDELEWLILCEGLIRRHASLTSGFWPPGFMTRTGSYAMSIFYYADEDLPEEGSDPTMFLAKQEVDHQSVIYEYQASMSIAVGPACTRKDQSRTQQILSVEFIESDMRWKQEHIFTRDSADNLFMSQALVLRPDS